MESNLSGIDSLVLFQNSQGQHGRGTLIHITRNQAVIEIYNPYSIVQISEVLTSVKVIRGERVIYHGKAVVTNIVTTGLMIIVSCSLTDAWSDLTGLLPGHGLEAETRRFVNDWQASHRLRPGYQLVVSTMRSFLGELSHWLAEAEATVLDEDAENQNDALALAEDFYRDIRSPVMPKIVDLITSFEREASAVPEDLLTVHKSFTREIQSSDHITSTGIWWIAVIPSRWDMAV